MLRAADLLWVALGTGPLFAHPMGNFSVNHYSRIELGANGAEVAYVLDLAEIPTFELLQEWKLDAANPGRARPQPRADGISPGSIAGAAARSEGVSGVAIGSTNGRCGSPGRRVVRGINTARTNRGVSAGTARFRDGRARRFSFETNA